MYAQERKQQFLNTFIQQVNGKGRSYTERSGSHFSVPACLYVKDNHPGCAIGCQPEFQQFRQEVVTRNLNGTIGELFFGVNNEFADFGIRLATALQCDLSDHKDGNFLGSLQQLHDHDMNWNEKTGRIRRQAVESFCKAYHLTVPESEYANNC